MTAFGTVGAVIAAVGIALWAEWRAARRIREERERADRMLEEERARSDRLLQEEREHGRAQIEEERRIALERERLAEAYAVQVINTRASATAAHWHADPDDPLTRPAAVVVNRGHYAITKVDAKFSNGESSHRVVETRHLSALIRLPKELRGLNKELQGSDDEFTPWPDDFNVVILTPRDPGLQLIGPALPTSRSLYVYPLVRWTDRWGMRWEHRRGEVRQVRDDQEWTL
jgi:hypothetical protein